MRVRTGIRIRPEAFWGAAIGALVVADVVAARRLNDSTLSCVTRQTFRVHTLPGRLSFFSMWGVLTMWFLPHICVPALQDIADGVSPRT